MHNRCNTHLYRSWAIHQVSSVCLGADEPMRSESREHKPTKGRVRVKAAVNAKMAGWAGVQEEAWNEDAAPAACESHSRHAVPLYATSPETRNFAMWLFARYHTLAPTPTGRERGDGFFCPRHYLTARRQCFSLSFSSSRIAHLLCVRPATL